MDYSTPEVVTGFFGLSYSTIALIVLVVALATFIGIKFFYGYKTVPQPSSKSGFQNKEGFFGGAARGTGISDCSRSSLEGAQLLAMFPIDSQNKGSEASENAHELNQIVSKLSCFKKDLVSPSHIVEATRYQNFVTAHDIEPIAETTARCFAKTISPRDLEISFDKWIVRGAELIRELCAEYKLSDAEYTKAEKLFQTMVRDVKDIARGACLQGEPSIAGKPGPRDAHGYESSDLQNLGPYNGYY
jgi:hypothetical protein